MSRRILVQVVAGAVVITFAGGIWLSGDSIEIGWLRFYSAAVFVGLFSVWLWDRWIWSMPWPQKLSIVPRDVRGTWKGELESFWVDVTTNTKIPPKPAYLTVRQTASHVTISLYTDESQSTSSLAVVTHSPAVATLNYMYLAQPDSKYEHRSRMHHGSASLAVIGRPAERLQGRYWTNRDSRGEFKFDRRVDAIAEDYEGAVALFEGRAGPVAA